MKSVSIISILFAFVILFTLCVGCREKEVEYYGSGIELGSEMQSEYSSLPQSEEASSGAISDTGVPSGNGASTVAPSGSGAHGSQNTSSTEPQINAGDFEGPEEASSSSKNSSASAPSVNPPTTDSEENISTSSSDKAQSSQPDVGDAEASDPPADSSSPAETSSRNVNYDSVSGWYPIMP